jgi:hypothetical protein
MVLHLHGPESEPVQMCMPYTVPPSCLHSVNSHQAVTAVALLTHPPTCCCCCLQAGMARMSEEFKKAGAEIYL